MAVNTGLYETHQVMPAEKAPIVWESGAHRVEPSLFPHSHLPSGVAGVEFHVCAIDHRESPLDQHNEIALLQAIVPFRLARGTLALESTEPLDRHGKSEKGPVRIRA